jgi:hypothetical protein
VSINNLFYKIKIKMKMTLICLGIVLSLIGLSTTEHTHDLIYKSLKSDNNKELFKVFHFLNKKEYELNSEEGIKRYKLFKQSVKRIKEHSNPSYEIGITEYADWTDEEFYNLFRQVPQKDKETLTASSDDRGEEKKGPFAPISWRKENFKESDFPALRAFGGNEKCHNNYVMVAKALDYDHFQRTGESLSSSPRAIKESRYGDDQQLFCNDLYYMQQYLKKAAIVPNDQCPYQVNQNTLIPNEKCNFQPEDVKSIYWEYKERKEFSNYLNHKMLQKGPFLIETFIRLDKLYKRGLLKKEFDVENHVIFRYNVITTVMVFGYKPDCQDESGNLVECFEARSPLSKTWGDQGYFWAPRTDEQNITEGDRKYDPIMLGFDGRPTRVMTDLF